MPILATIEAREATVEAVAPHYGDSPMIPANDRERILARFMAKVNKTETCWLWTACVGADGYGYFWVGGRPTGRMESAHRISYGLFVGEIPNGLQIDHLCRVRECVRPDHMEVVTSYENWLRGEQEGASSARTGICKHGHSNWTRLTSGRLRCVECHRIRARVYRS